MVPGTVAHPAGEVQLPIPSTVASGKNTQQAHNPTANAERQGSPLRDRLLTFSLKLGPRVWQQPAHDLYEAHPRAGSDTVRTMSSSCSQHRSAPSIDST